MKSVILKLLKSLISVLLNVGWIRRRYPIKILSFILPLYGKEKFKLGKFIMELDISDPVERLMYFDAYEPESVSAISSLLKKSDVFFDIGAHIGYFTFIARSCVGEEGEVHSFEPFSVNFFRLKEVKEINNFRNVFLNNLAVSNISGVAKLQTKGALN